MLPQFLRTHAFKIIAIITTIFPFIGYLIGYSYYNGYMEAYGLSGSEFPLTIPEIYYHAYLGIGDAFLYLFNLFAIAKRNFFYMIIIILLFTFTISILCYLIKNRKLVFIIFEQVIEKITDKLLYRLINKIKTDAQFKLKAKKVFEKTDKIGSFLQYSLPILFIMKIILISIMLYWLPAVAFNLLAKDKAITSIQKFIKNDCIPQPNQNLNSCVSILDENKKVLYKGKLIAHNLSNGRIAIMQKNEINIIQLKPEHVINKLHYYK